MAAPEGRPRDAASDRPRDGRRTVALAGIAVLAVVLLALSQSGGATHTTTPQGTRLQAGNARARSTVALVNSIGVVVHFNYGDTAYGRQAEILGLLSTLGVHHIRDAVAAPGSLLASGLQASAQLGVTATLAIADVAIDPAQSVGNSLRVLGGSIDAFEGPNEIDNSGNPLWPAIVSAYMPAFAAAVQLQAPGVALIQPSFVHPESRRLVPPLAGLYNAHPYPLGGPPEPALQKAIGELPGNALQAGLVFTETGYHNALLGTVGPPPVTEQVAAVYLPRLLVSNFAAGVRSTFIYELADEKPNPGLSDPEQHYGLVRSDLSPKPAFTAVRTLIRAVQTSPGPGTALSGRPSARLQAGNDVLRLDMIRPDGSQVIALWRPVSVWDQNRRRALRPPVQQAELTFDGGARDLAVWRPSVSSSPVQQTVNADRLRLELGGDLVLVSFR